MLRQLLLTLTILGAAGFVGGLCAQEKSGKELDVLEGTLHEYTKHHYRYFIKFNGQENCALSEANASLERIPVGSRIRVQGDLRSKYFERNPKNPTPAFVDAWVIHMAVAQVQVIAPPERVLK